MSDKKHKQEKSIFTLSSTKNKMKDSIPCRIDFIKELSKNQKFEPLINFNSTDTEYFVNNTKNENESGASYDTRVVLNKRILNFKNVIENLGNKGKVEYIKSGTTGHTFMGMAQDSAGEFNYALKVVAYPRKERYGTIYDSRRPENAEIMMIKLLSYFIVKKQTPHIVLPIGTFNTDIQTFTGLIDENAVESDNKKYKEFEKACKKGEFFSEVSVLISEWANKGDLLEFIKKHYRNFTPMHWKVIFFQIISTLAVIQSKFPSFRHNDLKANNILVHKIEKQNENFTYRVVRCEYSVPNIGYSVKIWDFDFACIPGVIDNIKVQSKWTENINVTPVQNKYYDLHYFFNTLIRPGFFHQFMTKSCIPQEAKDFVNRIVPKKYQESGEYIHERGRILTNKEYTTPDEVLKTDPYFEEFRSKRKKNPDNKIMTQYASKIMKSTDKIKNKDKNTNTNANIKNDDVDIIKLLGGNKDLYYKSSKARKPSLKKSKKSRTISEDLKKLDPDLILNGNS